MKTFNPNNGVDISYIRLRQFIGLTGVLLPLILVLGSGLFTGGKQWFQPSISHYYYSKMHIAFVGVLVLLSGFLITYKGVHKTNLVSNIAGIAAFGVAMLPTVVSGFQPGIEMAYVCLTPPETAVLGKIHYGCATILFVCFMYFCFYIFTKPDEIPVTNEEIRKKQLRNKIYKTCGGVIAISISIMGILFIYDLKHPSHLSWPYFTILFETTSLWPFGISWLLKGSLGWPKSNSKFLKTIIKPLR